VIDDVATAPLASQLTARAPRAPRPACGDRWRCLTTQELATMRTHVLKLSGSSAYVEALADVARRDASSSASSSSSSAAAVGAVTTPGRRRGHCSADVLGTPPGMPRPQSPVRMHAGAAAAAAAPGGRAVGASPKHQARKKKASSVGVRAAAKKKGGTSSGRSFLAAHQRQLQERGLQRAYDDVVAECAALRQQVTALTEGAGQASVASAVADRDTLKAQVEMLMQDIQQRVETERRLCSVNLALRKRIEQLQQERGGNEAVQRLSKELQAANAKLEDSRLHLEQLMGPRLNEDIADSFAENNFLRSRFHQFKHRTLASRATAAQRLSSAIGRWRSQAMAAAFRAWEADLSRHASFRQAFLLRQAFQLWRARAEEQKAERRDHTAATSYRQEEFMSRLSQADTALTIARRELAQRDQVISKYEKVTASAPLDRAVNAPHRFPGLTCQPCARFRRCSSRGSCSRRRCGRRSPGFSSAVGPERVLQSLALLR
jgi:hypothetical protein